MRYNDEIRCRTCRIEQQRARYDRDIDASREYQRTQKRIQRARRRTTTE
jgi:hypothetical protein